MGVRCREFGGESTMLFKEQCVVLYQVPVCRYVVPGYMYVCVCWSLEVGFIRYVGTARWVYVVFCSKRADRVSR